MDELISKLRSQVAATQKGTPEASPNEVQKSDEDVMLYEINTSQAEMLPKSRFRLDFDVLKKYRKDDAMKIFELKSYEALKVDGPVWAIVKSIESFRGMNDTVCKLELIDETGVIFASSTAVDSNIGVGSIICISDFSIWTANENHLNIVERNIKKVVN